MAQTVFKRIEKKYMLTRAQYAALQDAFTGRLQQDQYGLHTINNIYMDTDDYALIRASIEKPVYKEKLRVRSYGVPKAADTVYVELKKKFKGIVYKRRIPMALQDASAYLYHNIKPETDGQILCEIDWFRHMFAVVPKVFIAYDRAAYAALDGSELRVTFDDNIRWRQTQVQLDKGSWGSQLLTPDQVLMEVKAPDALPLWFARLLNETGVRPISFSKYGTIYTRHLLDNAFTQGGIANVS